jgi:hypothetical protein
MPPVCVFQSIARPLPRWITNRENNDSTKVGEESCDSRPLALSSKKLQDDVIQRLGLQLKSSKKKDLRKAAGLRHARNAGCRDSGAVILGQKQIEHDAPLALRAPKRHRS